MPSDKVKQLLEKFSQATIKAAMAERPEVMQASGWAYDKDKNLVQGDQNEPGATQLRNALAEISIMPLLDMATTLGGEALLAIPKVRKAVGSVKAAKIINGATKKSGATTISTDSPIVRGIVERSYSFPDNYPTTLDIKANLYPEAFVHRSTDNLSFLRDVQEGANWGLQRGAYQPTKTDYYNLVGAKELGHGAEAFVYENPSNSAEVLKQIDDALAPRGSRDGYATPEEAISFGEEFVKHRNSRPYNLRQNVVGYTDNGYGKYSPVISQKKVVPATNVSGFDLNSFQTRIGEGYMVPYKIDVPNNIMYENDMMPFVYNGQYTTFGHPMYGKDFKPSNVGVLEDGTLMGIDLLRDGGRIQIKPENRGKFTALKERTGHSASWFKAHGTPAQKKMAVFELNSRHWSHKHSNGGYLLGQIYDLSEEQVEELIRQGYEVERV